MEGAAFPITRTANHEPCDSEKDRGAAMQDDGSRPAPYTDDGFASAGSAFAQSVARWNGTEWSTVGAGIENGVRAVASCNDGNGPVLFAAELVYGSSRSGYQVKRLNGAALSNAGSVIRASCRGIRSPGSCSAVPA